MERLGLVLPSKSLKSAIFQKAQKMMPSIEGFSALHSLEHFEESSAIKVLAKKRPETAGEQDEKKWLRNCDGKLRHYPTWRSTNLPDVLHCADEG